MASNRSFWCWCKVRQLPWVTFIIVPVKYIKTKALVMLLLEYFLGDIQFRRRSVPVVSDFLLSSLNLCCIYLHTRPAVELAQVTSGREEQCHLLNSQSLSVVLYSVLTNVTHKSHLSPQYTVEGKLAKALLHFNVQMRHWWIRKQRSVRTVCNSFVHKIGDLQFIQPSWKWQRWIHKRQTEFRRLCFLSL